MDNDKSVNNNKSMISDNFKFAQNERHEQAMLVRSVLQALGEPLGSEPVQSFEPSEAGKLPFDFEIGPHRIALRKQKPLRVGRLMESIAYLQFAAERERQQDPRNVWCLVQLESLSERAKSELEKFCGNYRISVQLVILEAGGDVFRLQGWNLVKQNIRSFANAGISLGPVDRSSLSFSPNQQWVLKFLLLNGMGSHLWPYPENDRLYVSKALERASGVVQSSCYELLKALEARGFYVPMQRGYRMRRVRELLRLWGNELEKQKKIELSLVPSRPGQSSHAWWLKVSSQLGMVGGDNLVSRYSIGGGVACEWYKIRVMNEFDAAFHLASHQSSVLEQFLKLMGLVQSEQPSDIRVILHKSEKPAIEMVDQRERGSPYVDILQAAFDMKSSKARGEEQYEKILERYLYPFWDEKGWSL